MARFGDNPIKTPLDGTELLAGEDASTHLDLCTTPAGISEYVNANLPLAPGTLPGLIDVISYGKLGALDTQTITTNKQNALAQQALGFFVAVPTNGFVRFFSNPATISYLIRGIRFAVDSGTLTLQISINGTPITGFEAIAVTDTVTGLTSSGANTLAPNQNLEFTVSANAAGANLFFSLAATAIFP